MNRITSEELKPLIDLLERLSFVKINPRDSNYNYYERRLNEYYYSFQFVESDNVVNTIIYDITHEDSETITRPMITSVSKAIESINLHFKHELRQLKINKLLYS